MVVGLGGRGTDGRTDLLHPELMKKVQRHGRPQCTLKGAGRLLRGTLQPVPAAGEADTADVLPHNGTLLGYHGDGGQEGEREREKNGGKYRRA